MIDNAFELPKINLPRLIFGAVLFLFIEFLSLSNFGEIFGAEIWPLVIIWLIPAYNRLGLNGFILALLVVLGLINDMILGQFLGISIAINILCFALYHFTRRFFPISRDGSILDIIYATIIYILANYIIGSFIGSYPSFLSLVMPIIPTIALYVPVWKFLEITDLKHERG